jgi:Ca-activated chloride channel family protein
MRLKRRMQKMTIALALGICWWFGFTVIDARASTVGDAVASKSAQAREHFAQGGYDEALRLYLDAQLEEPDSPLLHFNVGDVLYKTGKYEEALQEFAGAMQSEDNELKAKTMYNVGNVHAQQQAWSEAVEAYKQALHLNSHDQDIKANLELALKYLEEQQQQQDQQQDQDGENSDENQQQQQDQEPQQGNEDEQQQDQQNSEQNESEDDEQQQAQDSQQDQENQQDQNAQPAEQGDEGEEQEQQAQPLGTAMDEEEAQQLLNALKDREQEAQRRRFKATRATRGKDW